MSINKSIISNHNKENVELVKLTNSMTRAEREKALTEALIRQGWKLVEDKCAEIGFKKGTEKYGDCVLKMLELK